MYYQCAKLVRSRTEILYDLIQMRGKLDELKAELSHYEWDSDPPLVMLECDELARCRGECIGGNISFDELWQWAEAVECRDDIGFEDDSVQDAVVEIANYKINVEPTEFNHIEWLESLRRNLKDKKMGNLVISIGRQFGSGGRDIGKLLADRLGISFYDSELIVLAAKEVGYDPALFEQADEKPRQMGWFHSLNTNIFGTVLNTENYMSPEKLFEIQSEVIRKIAQQGSCVIVGRCSDYVLRENPDCVSLFMHASMPSRIKLVCERAAVDVKRAEELIRQQDRKRAEYYQYFTDRTWGASATYDLSINVDRLGVEATVDFIADFLKRAHRE